MLLTVAAFGDDVCWLLLVKGANAEDELKARQGAERKAKEEATSDVTQLTEARQEAERKSKEEAELKAGR